MTNRDSGRVVATVCGDSLYLHAMVDFATCIVLPATCFVPALNLQRMSHICITSCAIGFTMRAKMLGGSPLRTQRVNYRAARCASGAY